MDNKIRAFYTEDKIRVYQAYNEDIAREAIKRGTFGRNAFDFLVQNAIMSTYKEDMGISYAEWKEQIKKSDIRCQWDPERDVFGNPLKYRSIQLGLRGEAVKKFVNEWIVNISDVTDYVKELSKKKNSGEDISLLLPKEKIYIV